jgi:hypothetical protein
MKRTRDSRLWCALFAALAGFNVGTATRSATWGFAVLMVLMYGIYLRMHGEPE